MKNTLWFFLFASISLGMVEDGKASWNVQNVTGTSADIYCSSGGWTASEYRLEHIYIIEGGNIWGPWGPTRDYGPCEFGTIKHIDGLKPKTDYGVFAQYLAQPGFPCWNYTWGCSWYWTDYFTTTICDIKIVGLYAEKPEFSPFHGEQEVFNGEIQSNIETGILWNVELAGREFSGNGKHVYFSWDGRDVNNKIVEPGTYTANVTAWKEGEDCRDEKDYSIQVSESKSCRLKVSIGSSADVAAGELTDSLSLFSIPGTGPSLSLSLHYGSLDPFAGSLGLGWSHSNDIFVSERQNGEVVLHEGSGVSRLYTPANSGYTSQPGDYSTLKKNADGTFLLTLKDGAQYHFNGDGRIASIADRNGNALTFAYESGLLLAVTDSAGRAVIFSYDGAGKLTSITDPAGNACLFTVGDTLESVTFPDGGAWSYAYGENAFLTAKTDPLGNLTTYAYDDKHRVVQSVDPEGRTRTVTYPQGDETVRTTTVTEKDGSVWQYTYDTSAGDLLAKTDPEGHVTSYTYDSNHNQLTKTDASGTTYYTYNAAGNMNSVTDVAGQTTSYTYNEYGQVTSITDSAGDVTAYAYDEKGNLTRTTDPAGAVTAYAHDERGNVVAVTDALGRTTAMTYDSAGNMTSVTDPAGNTTRFQYDAAGRMVRQTDPQGNDTTFEYDARGNLIKVVDPLGNATVSSYDAKGNKVATADANGHTTTYEYDSQGQMVKMTDAEGNVTEFAYGGSAGCSSCSGGADKLTSLTDANGNTTHFSYDTLGRLIEEIDPLGNVTSYGYDASGNMTNKTDAKGQTIAYSYDSLGRLLKKSYPDGASATFTYDAKGNIITAANEHIAYTYTYDQSGRATNVTDSLGRTISYEYDKLGQKTKMIAPDGKQLRYEYDVAGRLATILNGGNTTFTYDDLGRRATMTQPNGVITTYTYDDGGRLTEILAANASGQIVAKSAYTLDKAGNRLSKTTEQRTTSYGYDKIYRLLEAVQSTPGFSADNGKGKKGKGIAQAVQNQKEFYAYDPVGNRTTSNEHRGYIHNAGNQILSADGTSFAYDKNGNLIRKTTDEGVITYTWDAENRLIRVDLLGGTVVEYAYGPFGRRIEKKVVGGEGTSIIRYLYDNEDILYTYDADGNVTNRFIHGPGIDEPLAVIQGRDTYYYHADGLGSVVALSDGRGRVVQDYEYDSYGNLHDLKNRVKQPYTYTGREWDKEIGLYYYRARYYDPMEGRFISRDPIGFEGGINLYSYAMTNPVNNIDPYGEKVSVFTRSLDVKVSSGPYVHCVLIVERCDGTKHTWDFQNDNKVYYPAKPPTNPIRNAQTVLVYGQYDKDELVTFIAREVGHPNYSVTKYNCCGWVENVLSRAGISWKNPNPWPAN